MESKRQPLFVGVETVKNDLGVSRAKAYEVIKELNREMKAENPRARMLENESHVKRHTREREQSL